MNEVIKRYKMDGLDMLYIIVGSFILSFAFQAFMLPNEIISGGVSSLSIILFDLTGWDPAMTQYAFNIPLLMMSYFLLGKQVLFKSILGSLLFPFFTSLLQGVVPPMTDNPMLAALYGGVLTGIAVGLVYKGKGSTGGSSIVAQIIEKFTTLTMGGANLLADGVVIGIGLFIFPIESILSVCEVAKSPLALLWSCAHNTSCMPYCNTASIQRFRLGVTPDRKLSYINNL